MATMTVSDVNLVKDAADLLKGDARVVTDGQPVSLATVTFALTAPDASVTTHTAKTNTAGQAKVEHKGTLDAGVWELCVTNVTKPGNTYNAGGNAETCASVTV